MSNSSLTSFAMISPNSYTPRRYPITKITPHYCAGDITVENLGGLFSDRNRKASSNYGIGSDGRIGLFVEECNAAWTSSNFDNDNRAVTIECSNLPDSSLTPACWNSLILLCVDICQRNGIPQLVYTGDVTGNLTRHNMFTDTSCPGPWLQAMLPQLAWEVNARLQGGTGPTGIAVDGFWGQLTTTALQNWLKLNGAPDLVVDGEIWHQWPDNWQPGCTGGWQYDRTQQGSPCIRAMQQRLGVTADGILGHDTIAAMQAALGTVIDGRLDAPSPAVMRMQDRLNHGMLF